MLGNVAEWCENMWDVGQPDIMVVRGGNWADYAKDCSVHSRNYEWRGIKSRFIGFRVVREVR